jgi:predicted dinucleotide-binding enzyme
VDGDAADLLADLLEDVVAAFLTFRVVLVSDEVQSKAEIALHVGDDDPGAKPAVVALVVLKGESGLGERGLQEDVCYLELLQDEDRIIYDSL